MASPAQQWHRPDRRHFIGGSDARIIMGDDEPALIRLSRQKRGEIDVAIDRAAHAFPQSGAAPSLPRPSRPTEAYTSSSTVFLDKFDAGRFQGTANSRVGGLRDVASAAFKIDDS